MTFMLDSPFEGYHKFGHVQSMYRSVHGLAI